MVKSKDFLEAKRSDRIKIVKKESLMKQKRQSVQKKEAVLKAAMGEFLSHGYAAANMDRIATEANKHFSF